MTTEVGREKMIKQDGEEKKRKERKKSKKVKKDEE